MMRALPAVALFLFCACASPGVRLGTAPPAPGLTTRLDRAVQGPQAAEQDPGAQHATGSAAPDGEHAHEEHGRNVVGAFLGWGAEDKLLRSVEYDFALGIGYGYRFADRWMVAAGVETLGDRAQRDAILLATMSFLPWQGLRLVAGPGLEFAEGQRSFAFRVGAGYDVHLGRGWGLAPEVFVDFLEEGEQTYIGGLSFTKSF